MADASRLLTYGLYAIAVALVAIMGASVVVVSGLSVTEITDTGGEGLLNVSCFQDDPTAADGCGDVGGGGYDDADWTPYTTGPEFAYDANWTTAATGLCQDSPAYYTSYYIIPPNETGAVWDVRYYDGGELHNEEYDLGSLCEPVDIEGDLVYELTVFTTFDTNMTCRVFLGCGDYMNMTWLNGVPGPT